MSAPRAALFDLDGTLVDREPLMAEAVVARCARAGFVVDPKVMQATLGRSWPDVHDLLGVRDALGWDVPAFVAEVVAEADSLVGDGHRPRVLGGGSRLVRQFAAAGVPVGLVTGSTRAEAHAALDALGLAEEMATVVASEDYGPGKPAPDCYVEAAARLGLARAEHGRVVVFEDSDVGIAAALGAGMAVIATADANAPAGHPARQDLGAAHAVVPSLAAVDDDLIRRVLG